MNERLMDLIFEKFEILLIFIYNIKNICKRCREFGGVN